MVSSFTVRLLLVTLAVCTPLVSSAETVLLDFSSPTCGPCQQMQPIIQRLVADGLPVQEIDISRQPQVAARFGVTQVPTMIVVVDGRAVAQTVGYTPYEQLHAMVRRHMPAPSPRRRAMPLGQSPQVASTFAAGSTNVAAVSGAVNSAPPAVDLSQPQAGRVISLPSPAPQAAPPASATTNPFGAAPSRLAAPAAGSPSPHHQRLLAATVKITVNDPEGKSVGTGTIVDARSGEALVLTCGHLFRSSQGKGEITITTFQASAAGAQPGASFAGSLIDFDLERDLALISIRPTSPVQAVQIAGTESRPLAPNTPVTSVGCNGGQNATAIDSRVTTVDRYHGTPNVEVAGAPVQGRSGGGLFNEAGQLVGVCYAADPQANEGLYASLPAIYAKLDSLQLTMIYQPNVPATAPASPAVATVAPQLPPSPALQPVTSIRGQEPDLPSFPTPTQSQVAHQAAASPAPATTASVEPTLPAAERAALEEIQRRGLNSEVICIIRPQDPTAKSEVITLNNVSPAFVGALANPSASSPAARVR